MPLRFIYNIKFKKVPYDNKNNIKSSIFITSFQSNSNTSEVGGGVLFSVLNFGGKNDLLHISE